MLIYLDTKDLIDLLEHSDPVSADELGRILHENGGRLGLSFVTIAELSGPLRSQSAKANVMHLLKIVEKLPHVLLADGQIQRLELMEAVDAFIEGREYIRIDPFVRRFDYTVPVVGAPSTSLYLTHSMAETVWNLWQEAPQLFNGYASHMPLFEQVLTKDRAMDSPPPLSDHFPEVIGRNLECFMVPTRGANIEKLGRWIYSSETRCPANRLSFEVFHRLRLNRTDAPTSSDLADFNHILCLPYVDVATLDRRMLGYVNGAVAGWSEGTVARCERSFRLILDQGVLSSGGRFP